MSKKTEVVVFSETLSRLSPSGLYTFNIVKVLACMFYIRFWLKALLWQSPASQYCKLHYKKAPYACAMCRFAVSTVPAAQKGWEGPLKPVWSLKAFCDQKGPPELIYRFALCSQPHMPCLRPSSMYDKWTSIWMWNTFNYSTRVYCLTFNPKRYTWKAFGTKALR